MYRNKFIKGKIESFYEEELIDSSLDLNFCNVHLIDIAEDDSKVSIKIYAERPGIMIGSGGSLLKKLQSELIYHLLTQVEIEFKQFNPFRDDFKIN